MTQPFSFSFSGADIEDDEDSSSTPTPKAPLGQSRSHPQAVETGSLSRPRTGAFPISGVPLLPARFYTLESLLKTLPSSIAYGILEVKLYDGSILKIPRRELWDVRVQIMAEDGLGNDEGNAGTSGGAGGDGEDGLGKGKLIEGLGKDDVKTGVYEGGFKSWECSIDLVRVLAVERSRGSEEDSFIGERRVLEMGCGTALPSLAILQWQISTGDPTTPKPLHLILADYNPTVLSLVTLPNILLTWAQSRGLLEEAEGELEIEAQTLEDFSKDLERSKVELSFVSGAWNEEFVRLVSKPQIENGTRASGREMLILAAETIYSPFALRSFAEALMGILASEKSSTDEGKAEGGGRRARARALVGAKKVYFGVGGSIEDFMIEVKGRGANLLNLREEEDGVRRAVVEVSVSTETGSGEGVA